MSLPLLRTFQGLKFAAIAAVCILETPPPITARGIEGRLNTFCRVAPSVRFNVRATLAAVVFFLAAVVNVRTSDATGESRRSFDPCALGDVAVELT